jgi:hypothetical protein
MVRFHLAPLLHPGASAPGCAVSNEGTVPMLKKLVLLAGIVGGVAFLAKKAKTAKDERALWHEATTSPDLR